MPSHEKDGLSINTRLLPSREPGVNSKREPAAVMALQKTRPYCPGKAMMTTGLVSSGT
jgi:hypothetical protein